MNQSDRQSAPDRAAIERAQRERLARMLSEVLAHNLFYQKQLAGFERFDPRCDDFSQLPLTTRADLERDQQAAPPYGTNLSYPLERYTRLHQTSGSLGAPLRWLDTAESWNWWKACWHKGFSLAGLRPDDRLLFPFSFGPFIGFWSAFEAAASLGNLCLPAGGMTSAARLEYLIQHRATVLCCTPTYALHLAEAAETAGIDLPRSSVRLLIVAGEPGGSIPGTRARIERAWGARVCDHAGATEAGAWGFEPADRPGGLRVLEEDFIAEVIDPDSAHPLPLGAVGELVLTNLGRTGSPLVRYRTGDLVRLEYHPDDGGAWCAGGVLGRCDEMLTVRGNNVFPGAIEGILRQVQGAGEFRLSVLRRAGLDELRIEVEPAGPQVDLGSLALTVTQAIRDRLHLRPRVDVVSAGSLPRFEFKARRVQRGVIEVEPGEQESR